jgi:hypothetical protein
MIGKKPVIKEPAVGSPAKNRCRSPVTTLPSAPAKLETRYDRDEPFASEKCQVFGQLDVLKSVVQIAGYNSAQDSSQHAHVDFLIYRLQNSRQYQVTDAACQTGRSVVLFCESNRDPDRKDQREIAEDRSTSFRNPFDVEKIGLPQAEQQPGDWEHSNRQHQSATEFLKFGKRRCIHGFKNFLSVVF